MFGAPGICSKSISEHLPESFGHLIASSEHLDALREIARPVGSVRKASRKVVEATVLRLCEGRYLALDDLAGLPSHLRVLTLHSGGSIAARNLLREGRGDYATFLIFAFSLDANVSIELRSLNPARITFPDEKMRAVPVSPR